MHAHTKTFGALVNLVYQAKLHSTTIYDKDNILAKRSECFMAYIIIISLRLFLVESLVIFVLKFSIVLVSIFELLFPQSTK